MSVALTTPPAINTILGGNTLVAYDHMVLSPISHNPIDRTIIGRVRLTSTADVDMDVIQGNFNINASSGTLTFIIEQLDIVRRTQLTPAQITAVNGFIDDAQNAIEAGLISVGIVDGVQTTGA